MHMAESFANDRNFRAYALALLRHHNLLSEGKGNDIQIEVVEDRMSAMWGELDEAHRNELRGISSDLNWIRRGFLPAPKGRSKEDVTRAELDEFQQLNEAGNLLLLLHSVRACAPALDNGLVAFCRARCYVGLGLPEVSEPFLKATVDLANDRSDDCRSAFVMLIHVSPSGAFQKATEVIAASDKYPPVVVAFAIQFFVEFLGGETTAFSKEELADIMRKAADRLDDEPTPQEDRVLFCSLVGAQLMSFGFVGDSIRFLERGLQLEPENAELLGWLGEAVYARDRAWAVELFKRSILAKTRLVRPYLHLANHFLVERDFERANAYAAHAADMARDNDSLAAALEIMAISLSEQGGDSRIVLGMFRRAASLAPGNSRIAGNLTVFEKYLESKSPSADWETREQTSGFETRERWRQEVKTG
jgi:tetratricopeptide (TPR) repeat protein